MNPTLRRVASMPPLRTVLRSRRVEPLVATVLRASPVRGRVRFLARERRPPPEPRAYRLRESGAIVHVRHGTPDVAALGEVFYERQYEPPPSVAECLEALGRPPEVLDLGANVGFFGVFVAARFPGAPVIAFEPDSANLDVLRLTERANGFSWEVIEAAAAVEDGEVPFVSGNFTVSRVDEAATERVPAIDVLPYLARVDLAKIDIEGAEWAILTDERFGSSGPAALALEFHPHLAPAEADPEALLREAGYSIERSLRFSGGHGLLWARRA